MSLARFSVRNSLLVNMLSVFIFIVGIRALFSVNRDAFPEVNFDVVTISTAYPGAPAEDVEKFVTIPIEKELKGISGIKEMESTSEEGNSMIGITIDPETSDKKQVVDDINEAVDRVRNLPEGVEDDPLVNEIKSKERPIVEISISGPYSEAEKRQYSETLEDLLMDTDGVASVQRIGWRDREFWVELDPKKLDEFHVSLDEVVDALRSHNITLPGGQITTENTEFSVRISSEFVEPKEVEDVIIRANDLGNWLTIKDVGHVIDTFEDEVNLGKVNSERALTMVVAKTENSDVITVVNRVKEVLADYEQFLPENMEATISNDFSYYVKRRLGVLKNNGLIGFIFVLGLLFLFLSPTPAVVTALGIPLALFISFIFMDFLGISINLVSMLALIIVLGMLVDDGIIVAENIYRHVENGVEPREAAIRGTQEVIPPVTAAVLTTCAAFSPLLFIEDIIGKFIREIPIIVMITLAASLIEAFIILPSHMADFISLSHRRKGHSLEKKKADRAWFKKIIRIYERFLTWALNHRYKFFIGLVVLLVVSFALNSQLKRILFTDEGVEEFVIRAEGPKGTPLEKMSKKLVEVEELVATLPEAELDSYRTYIGAMNSGDAFDPTAKRATHLGQVTVYLTPYQQRKRKTSQISNDIRERLKDIEGFEKLYIYRRKPGPPVGRAIDVGIKGEDFEVLQEISGKMVKTLEGIDGVNDIETSYDRGKKQLKVVIDEKKAKQYFLTIGQVAQSVRTAFKGRVATTIKPQKAEKEINVLVRFQEKSREDIAAFEDILLQNSRGNLVPLKSVAKVVEEDGVYGIHHLDGKRVIYVLGSVDEEVTSIMKVNKKLQEDYADIPSQYMGYSLKFSGEFEQQQETIRNIMVSFAFAMVIIFIILTAMFNSLLQPFIVMLAIPFGMIGVILAFLGHNKPLSFFGMIGVVGLTGIVVNDSVVLVDYINRLRKEGKGRRESLMEAGRVRLRPVIMTTITTVGGLVSVAYGIGGGDPFLKPMALAITWGLLFATVLTLVAIPCIYAIFDDFSEKILHKSMVREKPA